MKKLALGLILMIIIVQTDKLYASGLKIENRPYKLAKESGFSKGITIDIAIISQIESSNNPKAHNKSSGAVGLCQITKPALIEYNQRWKTDWKLKDLYNADLNILVATWYLEDRIPQLLKHFKIKDTVKNRLWAYNAGIGKVVKNIMPLETRNYITKYERLYAKAKNTNA